MKSKPTKSIRNIIPTTTRNKAKGLLSRCIPPHPKTTKTPDYTGKTPSYTVAFTQPTLKSVQPRSPAMASKPATTTPTTPVAQRNHFLNPSPEGKK